MRHSAAIALASISVTDRAFADIALACIAFACIAFAGIALPSMAFACFAFAGIAFAGIALASIALASMMMMLLRANYVMIHFPTISRVPLKTRFCSETSMYNDDDAYNGDYGLPEMMAMIMFIFQWYRNASIHLGCGAPTPLPYKHVKQGKHRGRHCLSKCDPNLSSLNSLQLPRAVVLEVYLASAIVLAQELVAVAGVGSHLNAMYEGVAHGAWLVVFVHGASTIERHVQGPIDDVGAPTPIAVIRRRFVAPMPPATTACSQVL